MTKDAKCFCEDRFGEKHANWIYELAKRRSDLKALKAAREAS